MEYPGGECTLAELQAYLRAKHGSDRARKAGSRTWELAKKQARRKHTMWVPAYLMADGSIYRWFVVRGSWTITSGEELDNLENNLK